MIRIARKQRVAVTLVASALTLGAACKPAGSGSNPPDTDTSGAPPVTGRQVVPDIGFAGYPGENDEATRKYLMSIRWASDLPSSDLVDSVLVDDNNQPRKIRIVPSDSAYHVDWNEAINGNGNGYFVAKIYNRENAAIAALGIPGNAIGYLWVGRLNATERGVAIVPIRNNGSIHPMKKLAWDNFCDDQHSHSRVELTKGKKCPPRPAAKTSASKQPAVMLASNVGPAASTTASFLEDLGLWITCSGGCCEVKMRQAVM